MDSFTAVPFSLIAIRDFSIEISIGAVPVAARGKNFPASAADVFS